uniref:NADH-ubiquinone oxidoreductase chain 4L n=1 Tax=Sahlbergotettix salicicola TaxID=2937677 RepID=A0A9E9G0B3_9HEMI|nr:NADH dehydrogenase subunit 4L [Sahlbergotettix salicicola]WAP91680.1 NADH dehydrogenase subunit 4L [Sahlbergotettix salicicola]
MNLFFMLYLFMFSLFSLILIRKHILLCLLSLEFIILSLLYMILIYCLLFKYSIYIYLFFMTFYVCEGVLGLSVLVCLIRSHGNDYLNSLFLW